MVDAFICSSAYELSTELTTVLGRALAQTQPVVKEFLLQEPNPEPFNDFFSNFSILFGHNPAASDQLRFPSGLHCHFAEFPQGLIVAFSMGFKKQIGRASCRERV